MGSIFFPRSNASFCLQGDRLTGLKLYLFRTQIFHLRNNFMMFEIRFYILQIMTFYDISSFFDITKLFFHKLYFFQKKFFCWFFFQKNFVFHLMNHKLTFKIRFYILKTMNFYDITSFFDLSYSCVLNSSPWALIVFEKKVPPVSPY